MSTTVLLRARRLTAAAARGIVNLEMVTPGQAADTLRRREQRRQHALDLRFAQMNREAETLVQLIADRYRPRRILRWGSLLDRRRFSENSDIDIAVEGIDDVAVWHDLQQFALMEAESALDLVRLESIEPEYAESICVNGSVVFQRETAVLHEDPGAPDRDAATRGKESGTP